VIAVITQLRGKEGERHLQAPLLCEVEEVLLGHGRVEWGTTLGPVWQQLIQRPGLEYRAREDMCANFSAFFQDAILRPADVGGCRLKDPQAQRLQ
jgi:hypothetical protein